MYWGLQKLTEYSAPAKYGPERQGDVKHLLADLSWAEKYLGYRPTVSFEEGLRQTVEWYRTVEVGSRELIVNG
jgi:nucleoside-diphosphate-sugar epimerase